VQETLLRAWRHPEVVNGGAQSIRPWLFTVTRHIAIDMWRARSRTEEILGDRQADLPDPTEPIEQAVTALDMRAALAQLTPEHRQALGTAAQVRLMCERKIRPATRIASPTCARMAIHPSRADQLRALRIPSGSPVATTESAPAFTPVRAA
jgi:hypothetical protein